MFKDIIYDRKTVKKNEQRIVPGDAVTDQLQGEKRWCTLKFTLLANPAAGDKSVLICVESTFLEKNKEINNTKRK